MVHPAATYNIVPDSNRYMDLSATHHFTPNINMLNTMTSFSGSDQVTVGNGKQLHISHLGTAKLPSSYSPLVLHQDRVSKRVLLQGQLDNGLYKVQSSCSSSVISLPPRVFIANIKDPNLWHKRLGHPALSVVNQILDSCLEVHRTLTGIHLSQAKYIIDLLTRAAMLDAKPCPTPMSSNTNLSLHDGVALENGSDYHNFVGALQYCTMTSPDIAFTVNKPSLNFNITCYTDVNWASYHDDKRNTSGYCLFLGSNLVSWSSSKQKVVSRSSTESEYRGAANGATEIAWTKSLLRELSITPTQPPLILCVNISATYLATNPILHARTKHVEIDYHFVQERVLQRSLFVQFTPSDDQFVDCMSKPFSTQRFITLPSKFIVLTRPMSLRGDVKLRDKTTEINNISIFSSHLSVSSPLSSSSD
ncbi:Retrovirus-related Pol polyprotein from transposon RE1 [Vitis vinifera]|uniref:Retrovirus-related Pol polyprotein from transposon RE1 n=1 Tax=Vitis vinifera TaxID=29760 RepID=A0A438FTW9_VITVI|nr:Retrovirus-related Pol polyprotein from transposon RE1 [Vitis vinifera]